MFAGKPYKDQVVLITGGGTGLGKSMALRFAELGAHIVITSRKKDVLDSAAKEIGQHGTRVATFVGDVREGADVDATVNGIYEQFGRLDVLVNNAAGNFLAATETLSYSAFNKIVGIVLNGSFNYTLACGRKWIDQDKPGKVLSISTTYAWTGSGLVLPSACAKAGVLIMTRSLAVEWAKYHIRLNAIAPGPFPTEGAWSRLMPEGAEEMAINRVPARRFGKHEELANLACYLCSDFADYITGECVTIDGGEWFMGGEFNQMAALPKDQFENLKQMLGAMKR